MVYRKRKAPIISDDNLLISPKKRRIIRKQKISNSNIKKRLHDDSNSENKRKRQCINIDVTHEISSSNRKKRLNDGSCSENKRKRQHINIDVTHAYLSLNHGMVSYPTDYIQHLKETYEQRSYIGTPKHICKHCNACFWFDERNITDSRKKKEIVYSNCCKYGQIKIPPFKEPPEFLSRLINNKHEPISKHFLPKIRQYNSLFAFTSMGGNIDKKINKGEGPYVFRVNGQVHHRIGSLLPSPNKIPKFAELYIFYTKN